MSKIQIPVAAFDQHIIVLGKTRSGKSSAMRVLVEYLLGKQEPVTIVDPKGDWWGLKASADGKSAGYPVVIFGGEHGDVPLNARSGGSVAELVATGNRSAIIDLGGWMPGDRTQFWIDFASTYFRTHKGRHYLVIDEVHNLAPKGKIMDPNAGKMLHWSNRLASEGLGKGISMIAASQRPQKVHNDFLTSCETLLAMRVIHKSDRDAVKDWIDACGDPEKGKEVLATVASLSRGEAWAYSPEYEFGPKRVQFPMFETYDSFRPQKGGSDVKLKGWAEVDLADVTKKLEAAVKEAEATDPKKLQMRVRELEKQLKAQPTQKVQPAAAKLIVDSRLVKQEVGKVRAHYEGQLKKLLGQYDRFTESVRKVVVTLSTADQVHRANSIVPYTDIPDVQNQQATVQRAITVPRKEQPALKPSARPEAISMNGDLTGSQTAILRALMNLEVIESTTPSREQLAFWSCVPPTSGGYKNNLGALRTSGYINYPTPGTVSITDEGRQHVGTSNIIYLEGALERGKQLLTESQKAILDAVVAQAGEPISREDLAAAVEVPPTSGGFKNNLGAMRTAGLIEYPSAGMVKCAEWLTQ